MLSRGSGFWTGGGTAAALQVRSGSTAISSGTSILSVVFSSAMPNTNYSIRAQIANYTDVTPMKDFGEQLSVKSTTGFTIDWDNNVDTANYVLEWSVIGHQ